MSFEISTAQVLITGGSSGIGLGLASRFVRAGARVLVSGREVAKLQAAANALPGLLTTESDMGSEASRVRLAEEVADRLPKLNIVINNAGIQRRVGLAADAAPWAVRQEEIDVLLAGPVHLNSLLVPRMVKSARPAIVANVSSGGAFVPQVFAPVYSACKAAIHSYTVVLREALKGTACQVIEIVPPAVQTSLGGTVPHGADLDDFCDRVFAGLEGQEVRIGYGITDGEQFLSAERPYAEMFAQSAARASIPGYR